MKVNLATQQAQMKASTPDLSAWVSANAGSGKTTVLTKRVKRLLLAGVAPDRILCLTFTKAAAANMANRVLQDLAIWVALSDAALRDILAELEGCAPQQVLPAKIARARRIFAVALETPGGLKIQTIHAFCDALLHQFPFEAGVSGGFRVLDEMSRTELLLRARARMFQAALSAPETPLGQALEVVTVLSGEERLTKILDETLHQQDVLRALFDPQAVPFSQRIDQAFQLSGQETQANLERRILSEAQLPVQKWPELVQALSRCGTNSMKKSVQLQQILHLSDEGARALGYLQFFRTKDGAMVQPGFVVKKMKDDYSSLAEGLLAEHARIGALVDVLQRFQAARMSKAVLLLAQTVMADVEQQKAQGGLLDFSDMVSKTAQLLSGLGADWVRWKLDRGIDHILVDEAQDTSEEQWSIIAALAAEFFAHERAKGSLPRTLFAVGDDKQSIFSFQGAKPQLFAAQKQAFDKKLRDVGQELVDIQLHLSFRSSPAILKAVDTVFARPEAAQGVTFADIFPPHEAAHRSLAGRVDIWPLTQADDAPATQAWDHPLDEVSSSHPRLVLARRVAAQIHTWLAQGESVMDKEGARPMRPGDILILVRTRNNLFHALIHSLKALGVPVSGADRLVLVTHIAVMDLMALGDFILLPSDDLTLACVLKSPLIGLTEDDLLLLCAGRSGSLLTALQQRAHEQPSWQRAYERLCHWQRQGAEQRPYEFYAQVLGRDGGRTAFLQRLGREASDALDEFLNHALDYEAAHAPSLQGFLGLMRAYQTSIKREMEQGSNEVRVMTAHNAKGLEAKVVILPDTVGLPNKTKRPPLLPVITDEGVPPLLLYTGGESMHIPIVEQAVAAYDAEQLAEYRRLLYVAMTRAEERLLVAGAVTGSKKIPETCWYQLIFDALTPDAQIFSAQNGDIEWYAWPAHVALLPAFEQKSEQNLVEPQAITRPEWARMAPPLPATLRRIAPSLALGATQLDASPLTQKAILTQENMARGVLIHRLLQDLPNHAPEKREILARRYLENNSSGFTVRALEDMLQEVLRVLSLPLFVAVSDETVLTEVPISGHIQLNGRVVAVDGQIDRLVVGRQSVRLIDFKTGVDPASKAAPDSYIMQMALYAAVGRQIFPSLKVRAALLWTATARLQELKEEELKEEELVLDADAHSSYVKE